MRYKEKTSIVVKFYRLSRWFYNKNAIFIARIIYHSIQLIFGCTIPYSADLRKGVNFAHYHGIVIHQSTIVGENSLIYQNVCLGGRNGEKGPIIGKNCIIGTGACILGNIVIGDNVKIGANAVVLENIPNNCTVVGIPGKIVIKE